MICFQVDDKAFVEKQQMAAIICHFKVGVVSLRLSFFSSDFPFPLIAWEKLLLVLHHLRDGIPYRCIIFAASKIISKCYRRFIFTIWFFHYSCGICFVFAFKYK